MINRKLLRNIGIATLCIGVPAAVIGGYFGMSKANPYYQYYRTPITGDTNGFISAYLSAQYLGAQVIVNPGFTHKTPMVELFRQYPEKTKDLGFLLLDEAITTQSDSNFQPILGSDKKPLLDYGVQNTWSINFRTDLGSIRTGIALCMFLNDNIDVFGADGKLTFGMYGGLPFDSVTSFMGGMNYGIEWFNTNVAVEGKTHNGKQIKQIEVIKPFAKAENNFSGGFGPGDGDAIINTYLQQPDIDAFMPVAGPQLWSAQKKIIELGKKTILIGVDSPTENDAQNRNLNFTNNGKQIGNGKYVQFSSEKNLALAVEKALTLINNGNKLPEGEKQEDYSEFVDENGVGGFGTVAIGNIDNNCAGVSEAGLPYFENAIKISGQSDPSKDAKYSTPENMEYVYNSGDKISYSNLRKTFENPLKDGTYSKDSYVNGEPVKPLDLKGFISKNRKEDANKIKVVLSTPTSVLFDGSFSESAYLGMCNYYESMGIYIPKKGGK